MPEIDYFINKVSPYSLSVDNNIKEILNNFSDSYTVHKKLEEYFPTPLILLPELTEKLNLGELWIKDESKRFGTNALKASGASYAMVKILEEHQGLFTFCTATDGNHGRAVAWTAKKMRQKAVVFVPGSTVNSRIKNIKQEGARVIVVHGNYDDAVSEAKKFADQPRHILIQDTSWVNYTEIPALITAGYYTILREIENVIETKNMPYFDVVIIQSGVGSWPSSVVHYFKNNYKKKCPKLVCVEPFHSDCFLESAKKGILSPTKKSQQTIMAGLNCGTPSKIAWTILSQGIDIFISISDDYAVQAMKILAFPEGNDAKILSGESGAAGLGGLLAITSDKNLKNVLKELNLNSNSRILIFNTEGITDPDFYAKNIITKT
ncbi:MAG: diaminopropionate ammonia-lyase [Bacteroidales bacterium]|nr:diaminopropionate ammonia-lyase [Bacteroidales bacterium]